MKFYKTYDSENVINKSLVEVGEIDITLSGKVDIINPVIPLVKGSFDLTKCNYCFIDEFSRYYFIRNITVNGDRYILELECDVLETYKSEILNSECEYLSPVQDGDFTPIKNDVDSRIIMNIYKTGVGLKRGDSAIVVTVKGDKQ